MNLSRESCASVTDPLPALDRVVICFKPVAGAAAPRGPIPNELFTRFAATGSRQEEICVPLPATPALSAVKEVVLVSEQKGPIDLAITHLTFTPNQP